MMSVTSSIYCPVCNNDGQQVTFTERQFLHNHLENLHGYFNCSLCPVVVYVSPESLEQHNNRFHQGELVVEVEQVIDQSQTGKRKNIESYPSPKHAKHETEIDDVSAEAEHPESFLDTSTLTEGEYSLPARYSRDPLKGFFLQTILECKECPQRPTKKFATHNAWQLHIKTFHCHMKTMTDYKALHGDPDLVKFRHQCRMCLVELVLNLSVIKRHLLAQHQTNLATYMDKFREELVKERLGRPIVPPTHTMEGWWEGCMYTCQVCQHTFSAQMAFENHLSSSHSITGQKEIEDKYTRVWGKLSSLTRAHQCFLCRKVIRHEYKFIFQHLSKHKLDMETYAVRFRDKLVKELTDKDMTYILDRERDTSSIISLEEYLDKNKTTVDTPDPMEGWFDCSEHRCALCDGTFWSNLRFHWHIKREHGVLSTKEYRRLHGDPEVTLRQHKCQVCSHLIKWEASRIRDHLKFHKDPKDKLSLKQYGERFKDYILSEVIKIKHSTGKNIIGEANHAADNPDIAESMNVIKGDAPDSGFTVTEWKELFSKKVSPDDKLECNICKRTMNRHSFTRHQERAHKGILNMRDLNRLKKKQLQLAQSGVIKSLAELMRWAGGVAVVKGKGDSKEEVNLEKEDQESRLNLYKAGLSLEQIESKVDLINSGLTITKASKDKLFTNVPQRGEVIEKENELEAQTAYPTYVVDQETGEILIVEQIAGFEDAPDENTQDGGSSDDHILPDVFCQDIHKNTLEVVDNGGVKNEEVPNSVKKETLVTNFESHMLADVERMPGVWHVETNEDGLEADDQSGNDDDHLEAETGPLDGQIMQIDLPDGKFEDADDLMVNFEQVRIIRLEQEEQQMEEEQELEEEMLQSELETEFVMEDGKLCKVDNLETLKFKNSQEIPFQEVDNNIRRIKQTTNEENSYEKFESLVMLAEDGSARIVVDGEDNSEDFVIEDNYVFGGDNEIHYVLQSEDDGHFELHSLDEETREYPIHTSVEHKLTPVNMQNEGNKICDIKEKTTYCSIEVIKQDVGKVGDTFVLEQKDVSSVRRQNCTKQELKEKNRKNLVLEHRKEQEGNVLLNSASGEGQVIHQSELLDGSLLTGYVVVGEEQQVVNERGQEMVLMEEDQMMFRDGEQILLSTIDHHVYQSKQEVIMDNSIMTVAKKIKESVEVTETTNHYIQVDVIEQEQAEPSLTRQTRGWQEVGGTELEYDRKFISKPRLEDNGRVSQGTVVCQWTKMPGDRVRVAHSKVIRPRVGLHEQEEGELLQSTLIPVNISAPLLYSSLGSVCRDVGCQVTPHRVNGLPTDREEEQRQVERIKQFLACGGVLDRSCPGCGRVMSRQRNLVTHLQVIHGVEVKGPEGEEHLARYSKENLRVSCDICSKTISRKSIRRHVNLCHPDAVTVSRFTRDKMKA